MSLNKVMPRLVKTVVQKDPLSEIPVARMESWIAACNEHHEKCNVGPTPLPTRVLDIQDFEAIVLLETTGQHGQYIALSHCWGSSQNFITTRSTISAMKRGFKLDEAPATFRDAILVTRALRQRYLWIDSLCIIQGDASDWAQESSKMANVYSNSYFTIAALNAYDDTKGFLRRALDSRP
jgi:hypothetical protein